MQGLEARTVGKYSNAARIYSADPASGAIRFVIGCDGSRADVIAEYRAWIGSLR